MQIGILLMQVLGKFLALMDLHIDAMVPHALPRPGDLSTLQIERRVSRLQSECDLFSHSHNFLLVSLNSLLIK